MPITVGKMVDDIQDNLSDDYLTDARVKDAVGKIVRKIHRMSNYELFKVEDTFDTVDSQSDYDLSSLITNLDGQKIIRIRPPSSTYREVGYLDYSTFYQTWPTWLGTTTGDPINWTWVAAQTIRFNPIPNAVMTYTVYYWKTITETDNTTPDDTEIDIPDKYRDVVIDGASYRCARMINDVENAGIYKNDYEEGLQELIGDLFPQGAGLKPDPRIY